MEPNNTLRNLQLTELGILKRFIKICDDNNLRYYLCGGTLLGAVRHKGFIPWDDDIDVAMPREDYDKFYKIYRDKYHGIDDTFFIDKEWVDIHPYVMILDKSIKIVIKHGINWGQRYAWIDIFPMDGWPESKVLGYLQFYEFLLKKMFYKFSAYEDDVDQKRHKSYKKLIIDICNATKFYKIFGNRKKYLCIANNVLLRYRMCKTKKCCILWGGYGEKDIFPTGWFGKGIAVEFEGITANAPVNYDCYLKQLYGDYMTPKPWGHDIEITLSEETK